MVRRDTPEEVKIEGGGGDGGDGDGGDGIALTRCFKEVATEGVVRDILPVAMTGLFLSKTCVSNSASTPSSLATTHTGPSARLRDEAFGGELVESFA